MPKPVIFLAFANDLVDTNRNLRALSVEEKRIRAALEDCPVAELVVDDNASIDSIVATFQSEKYRDRIALFHFGGHADGFQLMLESSTGDHEIAHGRGLVEFFAQQRSLKLVFLNGCSTQQQSKEMTEKGIPMVIGTATAIDDTVATNLAVTFYQALAEGASIVRAWDAATAAAKMRTDTEKNFRSLFWDGIAEVPDVFPWEIYLKTGAESVKQWSLPMAAGDFTFGLPAIPTDIGLPANSPFVGLKRYKREQANVFFGRGKAIRQLYEQVTAAATPPITQMYGDSGTGKSSLLYAGLHPRLEGAGHEARYLRRKQNLGLLGTLIEGLKYIATDKPTDTPEVTIKDGPVADGETAQNTTESGVNATFTSLETAISGLDATARTMFEALLEQLKAQESQKRTAASSERRELEILGGGTATGEQLAQAWKQIEAATGKALFVILDQLEECFTQAVDTQSGIDEIRAFAHALQEIFATPNNRPKGGIILGYRKEYQAEISRYFREAELPCSEIFIEHLSANEMREVVASLTPEDPTHPLQLAYKLSAEKGLGDAIAEAMTLDKDIAIGPVFQLVLTSLWETAKAENSASPVLERKAFEVLSQARFGMERYFSDQMRIIESERPDLITSGLALDLLAFHVSDAGTAARHPISAIKDAYSDGTLLPALSTFLEDCTFSLEKRRSDLAWLLRRFRQLELLRSSSGYSTLEHDTLAPVIANEAAKSIHVGQRATRILDSQTELLSDEAQETRQKAVSQPNASRRGKFIQKLTDKIIREVSGEATAAAEQQPRVMLDDAELDVLRQGIHGMRLLSNDEQRLLADSLADHAKRGKERRRLVQFSVTTGLLVLLLGVLMFVNWKTSQRKLLEKSIAAAHYRSVELAQQSSPENFKLAVGLSERAFYRSSLSPITYVQQFYGLTQEAMRRDSQQQKLHKVMDIRPYSLLFSHNQPISAFCYDAQAGCLTALNNGDVRHTNASGSQIEEYSHGKAAQQVGFSPDKRLVITVSGEKRQRLYEIEGKLIPASVIRIMRKPTKAERKKPSMTNIRQADGVEATYLPEKQQMQERGLVEHFTRTYNNHILQQYMIDAEIRYEYRRAQRMLYIFDEGDSSIYVFSMQKDKSYDSYPLTTFSPDSITGTPVPISVADNTLLEESRLEIAAQLNDWRQLSQQFEDLMSNFDDNVSAFSEQDMGRFVGEYDLFRGTFQDKYGTIFTNSDAFLQAWEPEMRVIYQWDMPAVTDSLILENDAQPDISALFRVKFLSEELGIMQAAEVREARENPQFLPFVTLDIHKDIPYKETPYTASVKNLIKIWDIKTGSLLRQATLLPQTHGIVPVGANRLLTFFKRDMYLWNITANASLSLEKKFSVSSPILMVQLTPSLDILTKTQDSVHIFAFDGRRRLSQYASEIYPLPKHGGILLARNDGNIGVVEFSPTGYPLRFWTHVGMKTVRYSSDSSFFMTYSADKARIWSLKYNRVAELTYKERHKRINYADFTASGAVLIARLDTVDMWNIATNKIAKKFPYRGSLRECTIAPDSSTLLTISNENIASIWSQNGNLRDRWQADESLFYPDDRATIVLSPDRRYAVTESPANRLMQLHDLTGNTVGNYSLGDGGYHFGYANQMLTPDSRYWIAASDREIFLWQPEGVAPMRDWLTQKGWLLSPDDATTFSLASFSDRLKGHKSRSRLILSLIVLLSLFYMLAVYVRRQVMHIVHKRYLNVVIYTLLYGILTVGGIGAWAVMDSDEQRAQIALCVAVLGLATGINSLVVTYQFRDMKRLRRASVFVAIVVMLFGAYIYRCPAESLWWDLLTAVVVVAIIAGIFAAPTYMALRRRQADNKKAFWEWLLLPSVAIFWVGYNIISSISDTAVPRWMVLVLSIGAFIAISYSQIRRYYSVRAYERLLSYGAIGVLILATRTYNAPVENFIYLTAALSFLRAFHHWRRAHWGKTFAYTGSAVAIALGMIPVALEPTSTAYLLDIPIVTFTALAAFLAMYGLFHLRDNGKLKQLHFRIAAATLLIALAIYAFQYRSVPLDSTYAQSRAAYFDK